MATLVVAIVVIILVLGVVMIALMRRRRRLGAFHSRRLKALWAHMETNPNPTLKIIEADKILYEALQMLGYPGSLGDKLKAAGPRFSDVNAVWSGHKLRNRLAHELNMRVSEQEVRAALSAFKHALKDLGLR